MIGREAGLQSVRERLAEDDDVILLDGALGTELARRGFSLDSGLWSAGALLKQPELVGKIHQDYANAGAEILTANTFRTHRRNLQKVGLGNRARDLTIQAAQLAREAANAADHPVWIAGSQAPLEDCYRPQDVPDEETLQREHREMAQNLQAAGVDLILVETQNTIREAAAATRAAMETGLPVFVSFVCGSGARLLSGETLTDAVAAVRPLHPAAVLVNCLPAAAVPKALTELRSLLPETPIGVYANVGCYDEKRGWISTPMEQPEAYARESYFWREQGAKLIGGCCGTTPDHIRQIDARCR